jgi:hypothetical protein
MIGSITGNGGFIPLTGGDTHPVPATLTSSPPGGTKTVAVGSQLSVMLARTNLSYASFTITTTNLQNGLYAGATVAGLPNGVTISEPNITISSNTGTLSLEGNAATVAGTYSNLTLTLDGITTDPFTLTIMEPGSVTVGAQVGTMTAGTVSEVTYSVIASIPADTYSIIVSNLPLNITAGRWDGSTFVSSIVINASGSGTLTLRGNNPTVAGTFNNLTLAIPGHSTSPEFTLRILPQLTGTVTINNTAPSVGEVITATYTGGNGTGTRTWTWFRGSTVIAGATSASYVVQAADMGFTLRAQVSFSNQSGSVSSAVTAVVPDGSAANPFPCYQRRTTRTSWHRCKRLEL